jgi:hypothetical protein
MLLSRLKGKGHSITCHRIQKEGFKVYLHSFLISALDGLWWSTPSQGKKYQDIYHRVRPRSGLDGHGEQNISCMQLHFEPKTFKPAASGQQVKVT